MALFILRNHIMNAKFDIYFVDFFNKESVRLYLTEVMCVKQEDPREIFEELLKNIMNLRKQSYMNSAHLNQEELRRMN